MSSVRSVWVRAAIALVAACSALLTTAAHAQDGAAGDEFLRLVDAKRYAESWGVASDLFKRSVSEKEWAAQVGRVREPLGTVVSRTMKASEPQKNPPGAPPGDYLLQTYQTKFSNSEPSRTETLPMIKGADGRWRAVGYFVR